MSTRFSRKVWNGSYHSRSQWVWGTMATRRVLIRATIDTASPKTRSARLRQRRRRYHSAVPAAPWTPHLGTGTSFGPALLTGDGTLPAAWARSWAADPSRSVLVGAKDQWNAGRLDDETRRAAAGLAALGVGAGDRLLWAPAPSFPSIVALLGALRLGAVVVPANPDLTERELAHVVADVRPALAVADGPVAVRLASLEVTGSPVAGAGSLSRQGGGVALDLAGLGDPALIVYTSGTTGAPKGAVLTHANLAAGTATLRLAWRWEAGDRLVLALPLFHVHGLVAGLLGSLSAGGTAVVLERFSPEGVLEAAADGATVFFGVPTMYHRLVATGRASELGRLRLCVSGSAPLPAEVWRRAASDGVDVLERYGMTETLLTVSNPYEGERRPGTVGFPLPGADVRLVHEQGGAAKIPDDDAGVCSPGPTVFDGYWDRPAATAEAFSDGWFRTGDLASLDTDGYLTLRGRRLDLIISGGFNVYPAEVEDVLLSHPTVAEAAVAGTASEEWGEAVTAWVVPAEGAIDTEGLSAFAAARLAPYKRPRLVRVVDALPRNALGKVLRHELR